MLKEKLKKGEKMNARIDKLLTNMKKRGIDLVFITDEKNMHYFANFYKGEGYVVIGEGVLCVVTDSRYTVFAKNECKGFEVKNIAEVSFKDFVSDKDKVGFEDSKISYSLYKKIQLEVPTLVPIGDMIDEIREVKSQEEISLIKKSAEITDKAFSHMVSFIKPLMTEKEISIELEYTIKKLGGDELSFSPIVASGLNGALPHAIPTEKRVQNGELLVLDFGTSLKGYASDMTRTLALGDISKDKFDAYQKVLYAQKTALSMVKEGVRACDVDRCARDILDKDYNGLFSHSLGHGVGLDVHEKPNLSYRNLNTLKASNIVTIEPGIYLEGNFGIRIEDLVLVKNDGYEVLSLSDKELIVI